MPSIAAALAPQAASQRQGDSTPPVNEGNVRTSRPSPRPGGTATTNSPAPASMPAASGCLMVLTPGSAAAVAPAFLRLRRSLPFCLMVCGLLAAAARTTATNE